MVRRAAAGQDAVLHLAAKVDVVGRWADYVRANIEGTRTVVAGLPRARACPGWCTSPHPRSPTRGARWSAPGPAGPIPTRARGHYARSKAVAEQLALAADSTDLAVLAVSALISCGDPATPSLSRLVDRARAGRLPMLGVGRRAHRHDVRRQRRCRPGRGGRTAPAHGEALVVSNGEPRPVEEILRRVCRAAGVPEPRLRLPAWLARAAGAVVDGAWAAARRQDDPPITRFLAEQLTTAHWFDQRRTRERLHWAPDVSLDEGFDRLAKWYAQGPTT